MFPLHQTKHLAREAAHLERLAVEDARERVQRPHDVGDRPEAVDGGVWRLGRLGLVEHGRVGLADHLFAEVDPHQIVLIEVVVEHVLGRLSEVHAPLGDVRRLHAEGHVLRVHRARRVVVATNPTNAAGDEVRVAWIFPLHEHGVTAKDRRRALALDDPARPKINLRVDPQAPDDAGDRIPRHIDDGTLGHHPSLRVDFTPCDRASSPAPTSAPPRAASTQARGRATIS